jgi:SAM-dependent methyltransferase
MARDVHASGGRVPAVAEEHTKLWDQWNELGGPKYPLDHVVRFLFRRFSEEQRRGLRLLDLGCGSGVHTVFAAREGFRVTGVDLSETGVENTRKKLAAAQLEAELRVGSIDAIDFGPDSFDVVLSVGVLECAGVAVSKRAVSRAVSSLRRGGVGLFLFASDRDARIHGENPYRLHGYVREEVDDVFAIDAEVVHVDRAIVTYNGGALEQNEWLVTVKR